MSNTELLWTLGVAGGIAAFTAVLSVLAVKARRTADARRLALRATDIVAECGGLLVGPDFLWGVWGDTASAAAMTLQIRDARDRVVATVDKPTVVTDGVLLRFELGGRRYEVRGGGPLSTRSELFEAGGAAPLLQARHETRRTLFFRGGNEVPMFVLPTVTVFHRYRPVQVGEAEIGRLVVGLKRHDSVAVLSLPAGTHSTLEQVFVLAQA
jgi:hypothetical protein